MSQGRSGRIALAVAPERLVAARLRRAGGTLCLGEVLECAVEPPAADGWPALAEALRELATELGVAGGTVDVALLRRLAHARVVPLPPVRRARLGALVHRSARRHFPVRDEPLVADARRVAGPGAGPLAPALAACAPAALVEAVAAACAEAGFRVGAVVPGAAALAEAARARLAVARRGRVALAAVGPAGAELVLLRDGAPVRVQPLAADAGDPDAVWERLRAALGDGEADVSAVLVLGAGDAAEGLRARVRADEAYGARLGSAPGMERLPAAAVAALGAALAGAGTPLLLPPSLAAARARRARRRTRALAAGSLLLLLAAAAMHLAGLRREVDALRARRAAIAGAVADARAMRDDVEGLRARLRTLAALEGSAPAWTGAVEALAAALPDSAHLRSLEADSTGVRMAGLARSASAVVPALERHPRLHRVSLSAPVRFEQGDGGERFQVVARLLAGPPAAPEAP